MPNKRRAASLSLLCIFAFFFFLHYDDELSSATKRNNSSSTTTITSRKLLGLISFQDPKTVNLQDRDTESGILSTDAPVKIPCSSDDETLLLVQEFYDDHQHANCRHDFSKDIIVSVLCVHQNDHICAHINGVIFFFSTQLNSYHSSCT